MCQLIQSNQDRCFKYILIISSWVSIFAVALIFIFLIKESLLALAGIGSSFFTDESWYPLEGSYNLIPMLYGSLFVTFGAVLLAFPVGLFSALFVCFYLNKNFKPIYLKCIELYTGIPSVIFGFWGLMKIVPLINALNPPGQSLLAGILVVTLMIFPIITLSLVSAIEMSSKLNFNVSESLGLRQSTYIWRILLPNIQGPILGALFLSVGRAVGETMAVLMVCGNIAKVPTSFFDPVRTLTANIALEMAYAMDIHRSSLFFSGLILLVFVLCLFLISDLVLKRSFWKI